MTLQERCLLLCLSILCPLFMCVCVCVCEKLCPKSFPWHPQYLTLHCISFKFDFYDNGLQSKHEKWAGCFCASCHWGQWEHWAGRLLKAYVATEINRLTHGQNSPQGVCGSIIWKKIPSYCWYTHPHLHTHTHTHTHTLWPTPPNPDASSWDQQEESSCTVCRKPGFSSSRLTSLLKPKF